VEAEEAPRVGLYFPALQSSHTDAPAVSLKNPALQSEQLESDVALTSSLHLPFSHFTQTDAIAADHIPALHPAHEPDLAADE
jgi:hypothetical protein